jgi:hypothetical protein
MDVAPAATHSDAGLPRAQALYGSLPAQLRRPDSFASQLRHLLAVRRRYRIFESRQVAVPDVRAPGLLVMVHLLPDGLGTEITALNFGATPITETITLDELALLPVHELLRDVPAGAVDAQGRFTVELEGYAGKAYLAATHRG